MTRGVTSWLLMVREVSEMSSLPISIVLSVTTLPYGVSSVWFTLSSSG